MEIYKSKKFILKDKYFLLDIDGTLIVTKSGRPNYNPIDQDDWIFLGDIPRKLLLLDEKYSIILVSNQTKKIHQKYYNMIDCLESHGISLIAFFLYNDFRKPNIKCLEELDTPKRIRMSGDAINSISDYPPFTYSNVDYEFYSRLNIPKSFTIPYKLFSCFPESKIKPRKKEILILIGNPGSGKSTLAFRMSRQHNYIIIDDKKFPRLELFDSSTSFVIDNTNPRESDRQQWIDYSKTINYSYRIIWFIRDGRPWNTLRKNPIPEVAFNVYSKRFQEPIGAIQVY